MVLKDKGRTPRKHRNTRYGLPTSKESTVSKKNKTQYSQVMNQVTKGSYKNTPIYAPVSDEITPYGAKKFRTPSHHKQFRGTQGSAQLAAVLDIDGTMQTWGSGLDGDLKKWCEKLYKDYPDIVFLIVTARDHEWMYETSFNWVMHNFPWAYIGPFCRAKDDPRYASEFKRELCQGFEDMGLYQIIAAADDNAQVIDMWKHWAETHFENPKDFDLLECDSYDNYLGYRSGLPSKGYASYSSYKPASATTTTNNGATTPVRKDGVPQRYVTGASVDGKWVPAHWEDLTVTEAKHRPAGTSHYDEPKDITFDPAWGHYLAQRYGAPGKVNKPDSWPRAALNVVSESPNEERLDLRDALDEVIDVLDAPTALYRQDLEDIVAHAHPDWTPVRIADMSMSQLRHEVGIEDDDYRMMIYDQIANLFGSHANDDELDYLDLDEVEEMLDMTKEEIDFKLDQAYYARQQKVTKSAWMSEQASEEMSEEEFQRRRARIDLEDLVLNLTEYTLPELEVMDSQELQDIVAKVEVVAMEANADEAQAMGVEEGVAS